MSTDQLLAIEQKAWSRSAFHACLAKLGFDIDKPLIQAYYYGDGSGPTGSVTLASHGSSSDVPDTLELKWVPDSKDIAFENTDGQDPFAFTDSVLSGGSFDAALNKAECPQ